MSAGFGVARRVARARLPIPDSRSGRVNAVLRLVAWLVAVALVALPVVALLRGWIGSEQWPLRTLRAQGPFERVDDAQVRRMLLPYARRGFFAVDLRAAQGAVAALPWVEHAEVRKRWPDVLEVRITEHRPYARWGRERLLSERGRLFAARGTPVPAGLPRLGGPDARVRDVVELYQQSRELFAPMGLRVDGVELDARGSWSVSLVNRAGGGGATRVLVGRNEARGRIDRFVRLLPQLLAMPGRRIEQADLRYTNGFALTWSKPGIGSGEPGAAGAPAAPTRPARLHAPTATLRPRSGQARPVAGALPIPHSPHPARAYARSFGSPRHALQRMSRAWPLTPIPGLT